MYEQEDTFWLVDENKGSIFVIRGHKCGRKLT